MREEAENRHHDAQDPGAEVVDQHLEPGADPPADEPVEQLEQVRGERPDDHGPEEHRDVRADDDAHRRHGADDGSTLAVDQAAAGVADQDGQQHGDDRPDQRGQLLVGPPAGGDEEGGDQAPRDERGNVGHDHAGQVAADPLDRGLDAGPFAVLEIGGRCHWVPLSSS